MEGKLPEIYWYVFWIGVVIIAFGSAFMAGRGAHHSRMKALDILKSYADKGAEPPPAMMEQITRHALGPPTPQTPQTLQTPPPADGGRGALVQSFMGFLFAACIFGGLYYWFKDENFPNWAVYSAQAMYAFFGLASAGFLLAALFTRTK